MDKHQLAKLLRNDPEAFLEVVDEHPHTRIDLSGTDLSQADLTDLWPVWLDLSQANLTGATVEVEQLILCRLEGTVLDGVQADGDYAKVRQIQTLWAGRASWQALREREAPGQLLGADLSGADLRAFDLSGIGLSRAKLDAADLRDANLAEAELGEASLRGANLCGLVLSRVQAQQSHWTNANLSEAVLSLCDFTKADFSNANLHKARIDRCGARGLVAKRANFSSARVFQTPMPGAVLAGADFSDAVLERVALNRADLRGAIFQRTEFDPEYPLEDVMIGGADLRDATGCVLYGATGIGKAIL